MSNQGKFNPHTGLYEKQKTWTAPEKPVEKEEEPICDGDPAEPTSPLEGFGDRLTKLKAGAGAQAAKLKGDASSLASKGMSYFSGLKPRKTWVPPATEKAPLQQTESEEDSKKHEVEAATQTARESVESAVSQVKAKFSDATSKGMAWASGLKPRKTWQAKNPPLAADGSGRLSGDSARSTGMTVGTIEKQASFFPKEAGVILITGASRGIGLALCKYFAKNHPEWQLIAAVRSPDSETVKNGLAKFWITKNDIVVKMDIDDEQSVADCFKFVSEKFDHIDILINNAGIATKNHPIDPVLQIDPEDFMKVFRVNVLGTWRVTKHFLPLLEKAATPKVVNLSSDLGSIQNNVPGNRIGQPAGGKASYRATKAALNMLTRTFAVEVPKVSFMAMSPGWVATDMGSSGNRKPPLKPDQSAERLLKMIMTSSIENTGSFWTAKNWSSDRTTNQQEWELEF